MMERMEAALPPPPPPPPPPKVWCVTLRRTPPITDEDLPPIGECEKSCYQCCLIPPATCAYGVGTAYWGFVNFCGCIFLPFFGGPFFVELAHRRLELMQYNPTAARQQIASDGAKLAGCARCLIDTAIWDYYNCIRPLPLICTW